MMGQSLSCRTTCTNTTENHHVTPQQIIYSTTNIIPEEHLITSKPLQVQNIAINGIASKKSTFILKRESLAIEIVGDQFIIIFKYDAYEQHEVSFHFGQFHKGLNGGIPMFSAPKFSTDVYKLCVGKDLEYRMDADVLSSMLECTLEFCSFSKDNKYVPILIKVESLSRVFTYYITSGLLYDDRNNIWRIILTKYRIRQGDYGYQIQEVYGLKSSALDNNKECDQESKACSICLATLSDTILMPCRHLCVCLSCAKEVNLRSGKCPICRQNVTQIMHITHNK